VNVETYVYLCIYLDIHIYAHIYMHIYVRKEWGEGPNDDDVYSKEMCMVLNDIYA
jgi:hypothetical protein